MDATLKQFTMAERKPRRTLLIGQDAAYMLPFNQELVRIQVGAGNGGLSSAVNAPDIGIRNKYVSRDQCTIIGGTRYDNAFYVIDGTSKNGTFLNGRRVDDTHKAHWLNAGDVLSLSGVYALQVAKGLVDALGQPIDSNGKLVSLEEKFGKRVIDLDKVQNKKNRVWDS